MASKNLVEHNTKRINVRRAGHRLTAYLLRAGIFRSHDPPVHARHQRCIQEFRIEQLCDSKVQQPRKTFLGNQNVAGFQIAMDDQILVRILHGGTDRAKQSQAARDGKLVRSQYWSMGRPSTYSITR